MAIKTGLCRFLATPRFLLFLAVTLSLAPLHASGQSTCTSDAGCDGGLVCRNELCSMCLSDADCTSYARVCRVDPTSSKAEDVEVCAHRGLEGFDGRDAATFLLMYVGAAIAAAGGVGGGGVFIPVLALVANFDVRDAVPLSNAMILGLSIVNLIINAPLRHPFADRPRIHYEAALVIGPMMLGGTMIGVLLNVVAPEWLTIGILALVLTLTTWRTLKKGLRLHKIEAAAKKKKDGEADDSPLVENGQYVPPKVAGVPSDDGNNNNNGATNGNNGTAVTTGGAKHGAGSNTTTATSRKSSTAAANAANAGAGAGGGGGATTTTSTSSSSSSRSNISATTASSSSSGSSWASSYSSNTSSSSTKSSASASSSSSSSSSSLSSKSKKQGPVISLTAATADALVEATANGKHRPPSSVMKAPFPLADEAGAEELYTIGDGPGRKGHSSEVEAELARDARVPFKRLAILLAVVVVLSVISMARGKTTGTSDFGVPSCGEVYWILFALVFPTLFVVAYFVGNVVRRNEERKAEIGYPFVEGDLRFTKKMSIFLPLASVVAGIAASFLGIGGGMVLGPLMLEIGMLPVVVATTSSFLILLSSAMSVIQFLILGRMVLDYAGVFFVLGMLASFTGLKILGYLLKKYNKQSIVVFAIAAVISASNVLLLVSGIMDLASDISNNNSEALSFGKPCEAP